MPLKTESDSTVKLLECKGNTIKVKGLNILDGIPVIDIKFHWSQYDKGENARIPDWVNKIEL